MDEFEHKELQSILDTMNVPKLRKKDCLWLARNLPINNLNHPQLNRAMILINKWGKELIRTIYE
jgi:hypothetical protein